MTISHQQGYCRSCLKDRAECRCRHWLSAGAMVLATVFILLIVAVVDCRAVGFAHNDNFAVYSPDRTSRTEDQEFAGQVLQKAEQFRREVAIEWLGSELPASVGESAIYIQFTSMMDRGRTWAIDHPGREFHNVYLRTTPERALGSTLRHEIAHTVFASAYKHPNRLPSWAEEGIASRYDDQQRIDGRKQTVRYWVRTGQWPSLAELLTNPDILSDDDDGYSASESLVEYLLTLGDKPTVVAFAADCRSGDIDGALWRNYELSSVRDLEIGWRFWVEGQK